MDGQKILETALGALIPLAVCGAAAWLWNYVRKPWKATASVDKILERLDEMDEARKTARKESADQMKVTLRLIERIMIADDAILDALKSANIGNGNIAKARSALAESQGIQSGYLIDQIGG